VRDCSCSLGVNAITDTSSWSRSIQHHTANCKLWHV